MGIIIVFIVLVAIIIVLLSRPAPPTQPIIIELIPPAPAPQFNGFGCLLVIVAVMLVLSLLVPS